MVAKTITRKKKTETVEKELLNSFRESDTIEERDFNIQNIIDQQEAIKRIKHCEEIIKTGDKKTIRYEAIQGRMPKKFKDKEGFIEIVALSRSIIYFKIGL